MQKKRVFSYGLLLFFGIMAFWLALGGANQNAVQAAPAAQIPIYTPTPGPDGRIIYIVRANDTLLTISLLTNVPVDTLRELNKLSSDIIYEGQELLLGYAGPPEVTITAGPTATATPILPTPTPKAGKGTLCILLFNDIDGDSTRQENEPSIPDGAISLSNRSGSFSETVPTVAGLEHQCFTDLPEGEYTISVAAPEGYNATTTHSYQLTLKAGNETYVNFGAQPNAETSAQSQVIPDDGGRSPVLGIVGGLLLLAGAGVALFAGRLLKNR